MRSALRCNLPGPWGPCDHAVDSMDPPAEELHEGYTGCGDSASVAVSRARVLVLWNREWRAYVSENQPEHLASLAPTILVEATAKLLASRKPYEFFAKWMTEASLEPLTLNPTP